MIGADDAWRATRAPGMLRWRDWGADSVVFDAVSGRTHQLTPLAAAALAWLEEAPRTGAELAAIAARSLDVPVDASLQHAIDRVLAEFAQRDWIEPGVVSAR